METSLLDMQKYFEERMARFESDLQKKSSNNSGSIADDFATFKSFVLQTLKSFAQQIESVAREVDNMEMHSRRGILLLHGVKEQKDEDTSQVVADTFKQHLKLDNFTQMDIKRCHRMGRMASGDKPRPIVVKFQSMIIRSKIWSCKTKFKGTGITVSEFLTRSRHNAFIAAREQFGVTQCWTREGFVYILSCNGNRHRISSIGELQKIKRLDTEKPAPKTTASKTKRTTAARK